MRYAEMMRDQIENMLLVCTPEQNALFNRAWGSVNEIPENDLRAAYDLCFRTIKKNEAEERKCE
jgi:hypothetical protein